MHEKKSIDGNFALFWYFFRIVSGVICSWRRRRKAEKGWRQTGELMMDGSTRQKFLGFWISLNKRFCFVQYCSPPQGIVCEVSISREKKNLSFFVKLKFQHFSLWGCNCKQILLKIISISGQQIPELETWKFLDQKCGKIQ